ncbi:hypothetical protein VIBNIFTn2_1400048 [Vibrio nigripulchritudo FTn2]|nr:hypothetical protein VIBNIFTn2_1400048 [Vibrio nigripulchritudo FTn2]
MYHSVREFITSFTRRFYGIKRAGIKISSLHWRSCFWLQQTIS